MEPAGAIQKPRRTRTRRKLTGEGVGGDDAEVFGIDYDTFLAFVAKKDYDEKPDVDVLEGHELTSAYLKESGFTRPIMVKSTAGTGLSAPSAKYFGFNAVQDALGDAMPLEVIDATSQVAEQGWTLGKYVQALTQHNRKDGRVLNVISLEFSQTRLHEKVRSPRAVRDLDWIDQVWPLEKRQRGMFPRVQYYCLMGMKGSYTDFHIDFAGSSVWYHVVFGHKVFFFCPPTEKNLELYEDWLQGKLLPRSVFFGDIAENTFRVDVPAGRILLIPPGWIHGVFTPKDSLVFGGNFLHGLNIEMEVRVAELETAMGIEPKYQFPGFRDMLWFVVGSAYKKSPKFEGLNRREVEQLAWLADYLQGEVEKHADLRDPPHSETEDDIPSAWLTCRAAGYSTPAALLAQLKRRCKDWLAEDTPEGMSPCEGQESRKRVKIESSETLPQTKEADSNGDEAQTPEAAVEEEAKAAEPLTFGVAGSMGDFMEHFQFIRPCPHQQWGTKESGELPQPCDCQTRNVTAWNASIWSDPDATKGEPPNVAAIKSRVYVNERLPFSPITTQTQQKHNGESDFDDSDSDFDAADMDIAEEPRPRKIKAKAKTQPAVSVAEHNRKVMRNRKVPLSQRLKQLKRKKK